MSTTATVGNIHVALYVDIASARRFTDAANIVDRDTRRMRAAVTGTDRSVTSLRNNFNQGLRFRMASESLRTISRTADELSRLRAVMLGISAVTGTGITGAFGGAWLLQTADKARLLSNQLKTVTKDSTDLETTQEALFQMSQRTRSGMDSTIKIYARAARATETLGLSQEKLLRMTETIQKSFSIGGASVAEATGSAIQLSQGIASDRFSGEEFRSVAENAPVLLRGIAESLDVNIGKLREMAHAGELTADVVTKAIIDASARIDREFEKTAPTVGQSLLQVENAFIRYIGQADESYGATKNLSLALKGLADNFEEVMWWVTTVGGGLATLWGARKASSGIQSFTGGVSRNNSAIKAEIKALAEENLEIEKRRGEIGKQMSELATRARQQESSIGADQANRMHQAREKEYAAQQGVATLEQRRTELANNLTQARNAALVKLQTEVEVARAAVRDDQLRVIRAQEAALAEERILRAKQAQRLAAADQTVASRQGDVDGANVRVQETAAAIAKEADLRKAKIATEVEARRQAMVTQQMRLRGVQSQITEMRSLQSLPGFDKAFGGDYRRLLKDQQDAIAKTGKLRGEISALNAEAAGIDAGTNATRGMTAAMAKHAAAVKQAETAVAALSKAEGARLAIAAAPIGGKTLEARLKAEASELLRYERSVETLQVKMRDLAHASTQAFDTAATKKMVASIDALDQKLAVARASLANASRAVATAQAGDTAAIVAAGTVRDQAIREFQALEAESAALINRTTQNIEKQAVAQKNLNAIRRAGAAIGSGVLGFFGGPVGLGITALLVAATVGMASYAAASQKAAERTERLKKELRDLGIEFGEVAEGTDGASKSMKEMKLDQLRLKLEEIKREIRDINKEQTIFGKLFNYDPKNLGNILSRLEEISTRRYNLRGADESVAAKELKDILASAQAGKASVDELMKRLEAVARQDLDPEMLQLVGATREQIQYMEALGVLAKDYAKSIEDAANNMGKAGRLGKPTAEDRFNTLSDPSNLNLRRRMYPEDFESTVERAMEAAKKGFLDLIGFYEGTDKGRGYNETLGYGKFTGGDVELTMMTLREVLELQKQMLAHPENTFNSSAVGRYQIVSKTLEDQIAKLGLSLDDFFSPELQDRIAQNLMRQRGMDPTGLRQEWQGLNNAPDDLIKTAWDATKLPPLDEGWKQWLEGLKDLDLQGKIVKLDEFNQSVVQQAQSMGVSTDEIKQYVDAVSSGNLDAIPEKFKAITAAMQSIENTEILKSLQNVSLDHQISMLSEIDQKVIDIARSAGVAEPIIRQFIAALRSGEAIPPIMDQIKNSVVGMTNDEKFLEFTDGLAEALGELARSAINGENGLEAFAKRMADLALEIFVIQPLIESLKKSFNGIGSGAGGGGFLGGIFSAIKGLFGFSEGGKVKGEGTETSDSNLALLSDEEHVIRARQAKKYRALLEAINNDNQPEIAKLAGGIVGDMTGYSRGGAVGFSPPSFDMPSRINYRSALPDEREPQTVDIRGIFVDDDGVIKAKIDTMGQQSARAGANAAVTQVRSNMTSLLAEAQMRSM